MPLSDIVTINVTTTGAGVTRAGYGVPGILSVNAAWSERSRTYASLSAVAEDWAANTPEYLASAKAFSQSPRITSLKILRGTNKPTQNFNIGVQSAATGTEYSYRAAIATGVAWVSQDVTWFSGGATGWVPSNTWSMGDLIVGSTAHPGLYACLGQSNAAGFGALSVTGIGATMGPSGLGSAIPEGQVYWMFVGSGTTGAIQADAVPVALMGKTRVLTSPPITGTGTALLTPSLQGSQGSRTLQLAANAAGNFYGIEIYQRALLTAVQDQVDPGVSTDLNSVIAEDNEWYGLITLYNSEAYIKGAAAWVETNTKLYPAASIDTQCARVADSIATDVAADLKDLAYARSWVFFHASNDEFPDAAELGRFFPYTPGSETWRLKRLTGVTAGSFTSTEITNLNDKNASFYYTLGGVPVVGGNAVTAAGEYIDVTRFIDWYTSELQAKLANLLIANAKVPFTNAGIDAIEAKVVQQNLAGIAAGGIAADPAPVVTAPDVADISTEDKLDRLLTGVETEFTLAGAIHHITVNVTASA